MNASARTSRPVFIVALLVAAVGLIGAAEASAKKFATKDGNITCIMRSGFVRCDVTKHTWPPTPKPKNCEFDYGSTFVINEDNQAAFGCVSDAIGVAEKYGPGTRFQTGDNVCRLRKHNKVYCISKISRANFAVSRKFWESTF